MTASPAGKDGTPEARLRAYLQRFSPENQKLIRAVRSAVRKRLPAANELLYDYKTHIVIGYTPTEHAIDGIVSIAARATGVDLYFNNGVRLPDPEKLLQGSGRQVRFIRVDTARRLAQPAVQALFAAAIARAVVPLPRQGRGRLVLRARAAREAAPRKAAKGRRPAGRRQGK